MRSTNRGTPSPLIRALWVAIFGVGFAISSQAETMVLRDAGTGGFDGAAPGTAIGGTEFRNDEDEDQAPPDRVYTFTPATVGAPVSASAPRILGASGLNHFDNRTADGGNQFSIEPPDQALCVGNGYVIEAVNLVVGLRDASTNTRIGGVTSLNKFFGLPSAIKRAPPIAFGPFTSDPKCLFDSDTQRFFVTILKASVNPANGAFTGPTSVMVAVSKTKDPTQGFQIFELDTTNDGRNGVSNLDCPCLPDQPLIGMDRNGLYISTNEFPQFAAGFNGAQIYAVSKQRLAAAASLGSSVLPPVFYINAGALPVPAQDVEVGGIWYTVQPAVTPSNKPYDAEDEDTRGARGGIQYFLSALEFAGVPDRRVALWALTNTQSLQTAVPDLKLQVSVVNTGVAYISPPRSTQRPSAAVTAPRKIDGGDDRMQQVTEVGNTVFGSLTTAIGDAAAPRSGIAYWGIKPKWSRGKLSGTVRVQGYVSVDGNFLQRPSLALNHSGQGIISFSLIGPDYFPSAAYIAFDQERGARGSVKIAAAGVAPDNGFSGAGGGRQRWGDYSAAVDEGGSIWTATEYIPVTAFSAPAQLANWGTFVWRVKPSDSD